MYILDLFNCPLTTDIIKWRLSTHEFISHDSNGPYIDSTIITGALSKLRRNIVQSATISLSSVLTDGCPPEVADFADSLNKKIVTCEMTIFSGLRSLCTILLSCISLTPSHTYLIFSAVSSSENFLFFFMRE